MMTSKLRCQPPGVIASLVGTVLCLVRFVLFAAKGHYEGDIEADVFLTICSSATRFLALSWFTTCCDVFGRQAALIATTFYSQAVLIHTDSSKSLNCSCYGHKAKVVDSVKLSRPAIVIVTINFF